MHQISALERASEDHSVPIEGVVVESPETALSPLAQAAVKAGTAQSTEVAYNRSWNQFTKWCETQGREPLPATAQTITEYVSYLAYAIIPGGEKQQHLAAGGRRGLSPASIERALAAIYTKHRENGLTPPSREEAKKALRGYRAKLATKHDPRAVQRQAQAATKDELKKICEPPDDERLLALRNRAMALLGFAVGARLSELVLINIEDVKRVQRGLLVRVYRQKVRQHNEVALPREDVPGIIRAVLEWIDALAGQGITSGPLFLRSDRNGRFGHAATAGRQDGSPDRRITAAHARRILRQVSRQVTEDGWWTGHSLRRGFATEARFNGRDQITIAPHGGWATDSPAMLRYMQDADKWSNNALKGMDL